MENIKLLYESRQATLELINKCSSIVSEAQYKQNIEKFSKY